MKFLLCLLVGILPALLTNSTLADCVAPLPGIVSWWRAETNAFDAFGTNNGILEGSVGFAPGEVRLSFLFATTNADVKIPASPSVNLGTSSGFTLEAWICPSSVQVANPIFEWNNGGTWGVHFHVIQPGALYANVVDTGGTWHQMFSLGGVVASNQFQHVALTYNTNTGLATMYCNGTNVAQQSLIIQSSFIPQTTYDLYLGRRISGVPGDVYTFQGYIDEPAIYNRELSQAEIQSVYNAGGAGRCIDSNTPFITAQPQGIRTNMNADVKFNVVAGGSPPLNYQWLLGGNAIAGQTNSVLSLNNIQLNQNSNVYSVLITNSFGSVLSLNALLLVTNSAPFISSNVDQVVSYSAPVFTLPLIISDTETPADLLVLTSGSSNTNLLPNEQIVFNGTGTNRAVTITPISNQTGVATITLTVADQGARSSQTSFNFTVTNYAPQITAISNQLVSYNHSAGPLAFAISDTETPADLLVLASVSSNTSLVPNGQIVLTGTGTNRTVTLTPASNQTGVAIITLTVTDLGARSSQTSFNFTVTNYAPQISTISNQLVSYSHSAGPLAFTISDSETPADSLVLTPGSSNTNLLPNENIVFNGTGTNRSITLTPLSNQTGIATITLTVADQGPRSSQTSFNFTVTNFAPQISAISNQLVSYNHSVGPLVFSISDTETPADLLVLTPSSSNTNLLPNEQIVIAGIGTNRTVTLTPLTNVVDATIVTLTISDSGGVSNQTSFTFTTQNVPPQISSIGNKHVTINTPIPPIAFTVIDTETPADLLTIAGISSNTNLVAKEQIVFGGSGTNRIVTLMPVPNQVSNTTISLTVTDELGATNRTFFTLFVDPPGLNVVAWGGNSSGQANVPLSATNVIAIAAGLNHSLAVRSNGTVIAWGNNSSGQTNVPAGATNVVAVSGGDQHSLALRADGTVIVWGNNSFGQTNVPPSATNVVAVAAGYNHNLALRSDGKIIAWGNNSLGQTNASTSATNFVAVAAGWQHSVALCSDGTVRAWGAGRNRGGGFQSSPNFGQSRVPASATNIVAIAAGAMHNVLLRADGSVIAWGDNRAGQTNVPAAASNVVAIAAGTNCSMALRSDGSIIAWGASTATNIPTDLQDAFAIAAGATHGLGLIGDGSPHILVFSPGGNAVAGSPVPLFVRAVGRAPLSYQWLANGILIPDATNASPTIAAVLGTDDVAYQAVVSNSIGSVTSQVARATIKAVGAWGDNRIGKCNIPATVTNPIAIAAGGFHSLALQPDGSVVGWGKNWDGQINIPQAATNVVAIAAGSDHSLALRNDGSVIAWGRNGDGQATVPPEATNIVSLAAGWAHSLGLRADGTVVAWGNNDYGQTSVSFLAMNVIAIAAGYYHNLALRADGTVVQWGTDNLVPQRATNIVAIAAGREHSLALKADGTIVAWGDNTYGQTNIPPSATNVIAITAGFYHNLALRADGTVIAWGKNVNGVLKTPVGLANVASLETGEDFNLVLAGFGAPRFGHPLQTVVSHAGGQVLLTMAVQAGYPSTFQWLHGGIPINGATNRNLLLTNIRPSVGDYYSLVASNSSGQATSEPIYLNTQPDPVTVTAIGAWGDDLRGQCDIPATVKNPRAIAAGAFHSVALQADGIVLAWGKNTYGQTNIPPNLTNVVAIAAGANHNLALRQDGSVVAWGLNGDGQTNVPPTATNIVAIAAGSAHSVALTAEGSVIAWGSNEFGQTNVPPYLTNAIAVAAGYYHNLALLSDRTVVSWGWWDTVPASATNIVSISGGWTHSLALRADGYVVAWGDNSYGQSTVPSSATNIIALAAGYAHSLALRDDGTLVVWGKGYLGATNIPNYLDNVAKIAAGENHSMALRELGPPRVISQTKQLALHVGNQTLLTSSTSGTYPLGYQWSHAGIAIEGATNRWLQLANLQLSDQGDYSLMATNVAGQTVVSQANTVVLLEPSVSQQAAPRFALVGSALCLSTVTGGQAPLSFTWYRDGGQLSDDSRVSGTTSPTLCIAACEYRDSGNYVLIASNSFGMATGLVMRLTITPILGWGNNSFGQRAIPMGATNIVSISAGDDHALALRADGTMLAWGDNDFGQTNVPFTANVVAISAGARHNLALTDVGSILAWGDNSQNQTQIPMSATNAIAVAAGDSHSLALIWDGRVIAWGSNGYGQANVPSQATNIVAIAAGDFHSVALRADGSVFCWGMLGQPLVPSSASNIVAIAAGGRLAMALRNDGALLTWGRNFYGQKDAPSSATNVAAITAGGDHALALLPDSTILTWGGNYFGQASPPDAPTNLIAISAGGAHSLTLNKAGSQNLTPRTSLRSATISDQVVLRAAPTINGPSSYQWQLNGTSVSSGTNLVLILSNVHWTNAGTYRLITSNALVTTTSSPVSLTILRTPLRFDPTVSSSQLTNGNFALRLLGASGTGPLTIYSSTNLQTWDPIFTNPPIIGTLDFTAPFLSIQPSVFFRASEPDNP